MERRGELHATPCGGGGAPHAPTLRPPPPACLCSNIAARIFQGIERGGLYQGSLLPVLAVNQPMLKVLESISAIHPSILATSTRKIQQCKMLFDRCGWGGEGEGG
jgi:hypothetical protein